MFRAKQCGINKKDYNKCIYQFTKSKKSFRILLLLCYIMLKDFYGIMLKGEIKMKNKRNAFTLVELMIVIAVIGILAAMALPNMKYARERARQSKCFEYSSLLSRTAEIYYVEKKTYPDNADRLTPYLGAGNKGFVCPSGGIYQHLSGSGEGETTYIFFCSFHGVASGTWGMAQ